MTNRDEMLQVISDLSKDAYGFRVRLDYAAMSDEELCRTWDGFINAAEEASIVEATAAIKAQKLWEQRINQYVSDFNIDRATAIRWDMDGIGADNDIGYYCYLNGMSYELESRIENERKGN